MQRPENLCIDCMALTVSALSLLVIIVNCLHLVALLQLKSLKGRPHRHVVINITLAGIASALMTTMSYSCYGAYRRILNLDVVVDKDSMYTIFVHGLLFVPFYTYYWVFFVASLEYYAICRPREYTTAFLIRKLPWVLCFCWVLPFVLISFFVCLTFYVSTTQEQFFLNKHLGFAALLLAPWSIAIVVFSLVWKELKRTRIDVASDERKQAINAAMYLIITFVIFSSYLLLDVVVMVLLTTFNLKVMYRIAAIMRVLYTIINIVVYAAKTEPYRQHLRQCVRSRR